MEDSQSRGGFPWGLLILGLGGYLLYTYSQSPPGTATIAPGEPMPSPPATLPASQPVATATPAQLQPITTPLTARQIVQQAAQSINSPSWLAFAQQGTDGDIQGMANIIQGEWAQYGRCHTAECSNFWAYIVNKYNIQ